MSFKRLQVAYLGPKGTYTHQASIQQFKDQAVDLLPQKSINDCFAKASNGEVDYAVVPFENSTNGQVTFTYDLLRDSIIMPHDILEEPRLKVVGEQFVSIHHCLLSHAKNLGQIKKIYTHPQAWGQCNRWLNKYGADLERIDSSSTSRAAELANQEGEESCAIASSYSSEIYNIPILYENIEDNKNNTTRFLILGKKPLITTDFNSKPKSKSVTLLGFKVTHNDSGALVRALNILAKHGINLSSITSRPSLQEPWHYVFFVEFWGDSQNDDGIKTAIEEFQENTLSSVVLGTFPRNQRYYMS